MILRAATDLASDPGSATSVLPPVRDGREPSEDRSSPAVGVRFEKVRKVYAPGQEATVKDVDLTIDDGTFFILLGPSGCGKSTMLRMIAGLETVTAGSIRIGEREVNDVPPKDRDIAMVFQSYALYPHLTVGQNMGFGLKMRGEPKAEIARRIAEIAPALGLEELLDRLPKALSGGQRQRVALGRAIVREPKVFLLDEPLSNLDAKLRGSMRVELKRLHRRLKTTMVYVTHDQVEAMTLGDQVAVLNDGVIQQVGPPMEVYEKPVNRFVAGFLGSPPMNFLPATATASGLDLGDGVSIDWPDHLRDAVAPGGQVEAGVRPEHVTLSERDDDGPRGVVAVTEPLGAETIVTVDVETTSGPVAIVARLTDGPIPRAGEAVRLRLDPSALHLFDGASGDRIGVAP